MEGNFGQGQIFKVYANNATLSKQEKKPIREDMINVYVHCANKADATSWYRAYGCFPDIERRSNIRFREMRELFPKLESDPKKTYLDWTKAIKCDVAFFQRSFGGNIIQYAQTLKDLGSLIWYDLDDNLWEIPSTYKVKKHFNPHALSEIKEFVKLADILTVSTQALKDYLDPKFNVNCTVINNGIDFDRHPILPPSQTGKVLWRGSSTHATDLNVFRQVYESFNDIIFFGYDPILNEPKLKVNGSFIKSTDPSLYYLVLKSINPSFMLCTLSDNIFNQCKSNISYLEATLAGAISVNNQVGEFKGKGLSITTDNELDFDQFKTYFNEAREDCLTNYHLKLMNDKRIQLIRDNIPHCNQNTPYGGIAIL